jgi:hypothetical protein
VSEGDLFIVKQACLCLFFLIIHFGPKAFSIRSSASLLQSPLPVNRKSKGQTDLSENPIRSFLFFLSFYFSLKNGLIIFYFQVEVVKI